MRCRATTSRALLSPPLNLFANLETRKARFNQHKIGSGQHQNHSDDGEADREPGERVVEGVIYGNREAVQNEGSDCGKKSRYSPLRNRRPLRIPVQPEIDHFIASAR